jgi:3-hydroxyisobutyrate dehydrogenase-like beta-hydroxyacid dehydrogenase
VFDRFVALPILGSPQAVSEGEATYLVGGPEEHARRLDPLLDTRSPRRHRYPSAPMASAAKLATNLRRLHLKRHSLLPG